MFSTTGSEFAVSKTSQYDVCVYAALSAMLFLSKKLNISKRTETWNFASAGQPSLARNAKKLSLCRKKYCLPTSFETVSGTAVRGGALAGLT